MKRAVLALTLIAAPALAQEEMDHSGHDMAGMAMPDGMASLDDQPGNATPPPVPTDNIEDRYYDANRMEAARRHLAHVGHYATSAVLIDELEYRAADGRDGYGWKAQGWYGNDYDKLAVTTEGEGTFGKAPERAETSLLWRHAVNPWFNLETGVRHDFRPDPERTYAVAGIQGLAPYWFELEGQMLISDKGDVHSRLSASYDQRITQRLILEPEAEVNLALQDVPELGIGAGFERIELGARLRYEIEPGFGPYLGVHWERRLGGSADYARAEGEDPSQVAAVFGLRAWF
ncbi:copper resistance protein B [Novosphingobium naphthalenivorans]|uniref:copper resistance protein B n=1 Tax=Novosphingobium naphthalenivorans TaxID=273168 RepID=UPI000834681F|nr:copper resistance protein B [Novosphingobium naphthalenivorans]